MSEKKEYIERGALIAAMHKKTEQYHLRVAMELPAADVEPVVRCKKCKRCEEADEETKQLYDADSDELYCRHLDCLVKPSGFCSAGKERER